MEETPPQVAENPAAARFAGRTVTVRRLKNADQMPLSPVTEAAAEYLNNAEPYAKTNLYLVGLLLLYRKFSPDTLKQKIIIKILERLSARLLDYINRHEYPDQHPMVCSQFVTQCYEDAGPDYELSFTASRMRLQKTDRWSILDRAIIHVKAARSPELLSRLAAAPVLSVEDPQESDEDLCRQMKILFEQEEDRRSEEELLPETLEALYRFAQLSAVVRYGGPVDAGEDLKLGVVPNAIQMLKDDENIFITPGDLLLHCSSLEDVGRL